MIQFLRKLHPVVLILFVLALGLFFARLELMQVVAPDYQGEIAEEHHYALQDLFIAEPELQGEQKFTNYHAWMLCFMVLVFHLPLFVSGGFSLKLEARIVACLLFFWVINDFFWSFFHPLHGQYWAAGEHVSWHENWFLGLPRSYWFFIFSGGVFYWFSFREAPLGAAPPEAPKG